ncbi:MAG: hypothetical protein ACRBF0_14740 [Calditrichia bacterium]
MLKSPFLFMLLSTVLFAGESEQLGSTDSIEVGLPKVIYCVVALCDNATQGIAPVPAKLGNGNDADNNLYWGALYGIRSYFDRSDEWKRISKARPLNTTVVERCIYKHVKKDIYLIADAFRGSEIETAIGRVVSFGSAKHKLSFDFDRKTVQQRPSLIAYIGHNGLMEFALDDDLSELPGSQDVVEIAENPTPAIILACYSKSYFKQELEGTSAYPLLWTTGLMAPEAYTLHEALAGWIENESDEQIRNRAAAAYHKYQKCGLRAARRLLITGW